MDKNLALLLQATARARTARAARYEADMSSRTHSTWREQLAAAPDSAPAQERVEVDAIQVLAAVAENLHQLADWITSLIQPQDQAHGHDEHAGAGSRGVPAADGH